MTEEKTQVEREVEKALGPVLTEAERAFSEGFDEDKDFLESAPQEILSEDDLWGVEVWLAYAENTLEELDQMIDGIKKPLYNGHRYALDMRRESVIGKIHEKVDEVRELLRSYLDETGTESDDFVLRNNWRAEVTDMEELVQAVANGEAPIGLLTVDDKYANKAASTLQDNMQYPGIKAVNNKTLARRPS